MLVSAHEWVKGNYRALYSRLMRPYVNVFDKIRKIKQLTTCGATCGRDGAEAREREETEIRGDWTTGDRS